MGIVLFSAFKGLFGCLIGEGEPGTEKGPVNLLPGERMVQEVPSPPFKRYRTVKRRKARVADKIVGNDFEHRVAMARRAEYRDVWSSGADSDT